MKFTKVRDVKSPCRGTNKSAGIDFFIPNTDTEIILHPKSDVLIPSGIKMEIPKGFMLMAADKSGVVTSRIACVRAGRTPKPDSFPGCVILGAKIIDEDYQGEIHIHLINLSNTTLILRPGMKIAQLILVPVSYEELVEVKPGELFVEKSERGEGGFGSTGSE